jgi:predicted PurR-regulated permease PerM
MARGATGNPQVTAQRGSSVETIIAVSAVAAALYLGRAIAIPVAIAILISFSLGPVVSWLRRRRIGRLPAIIVAVAPALLAIGAFAYVVTTEIGRLAENIPSYQSNIETKIDSLRKSLPSRDLLDRGAIFLRGLGVERRLPEAPAPAAKGARQHGLLTAPANDGRPIEVEVRNPELSPVDLLGSILGPLVEPLSDAGLVLLFVIFFLAEKETLRDRLIRLAGVSDLHRTTMAMDEAGKRVSRYLLMQTLVNAVFGVIVAVGLSILGLPNAALWGGMAAALRFIPYLGVAASAVLPLALAFAVDPGWSMLFWTAGLFVALELVVGNLVEPWLYGPSTGLSAVALIVSVIFWTWLWGTIGLLLATPLTVCIAVIGRYVPQLSFLDILLGNDAPLKPEESFYQRLLAGDPVEATSQAHDFIKANSLGGFFAQVALPALMLAERDRSRGALDDEHLKRIAGGVMTVVAQLRRIHAPPAGGQIAGEEDATGRSDIALCIAGRTALDEAAAALLVAMLMEDGCQAIGLPYDSAIRLSVPAADERRVRAVFLSYLDPQAVPQARYLTRRVRRQLGAEPCLIVALWGLEQDGGRLEYAKTETRADRIVTSLPAAVQAADEAVGGRAGMEQDEGPSLRDLARQVASAIEHSA